MPRNVKKNKALPLVVAIPNESCKAFMEIDQWDHLAFENGFLVFSVDTVTGSRKGWHYKEQLEMSRDMEAVIEGLKVALDAAKRKHIQVDLSATVITGWSGGAYLAAWRSNRLMRRTLRQRLVFPRFCRAVVYRADPARRPVDGDASGDDTVPDAARRCD